MNDFKDILFALGRGFIKIAISALVGVGVGLLFAGITMSNKLGPFQGRASDADVLIGVGAGLLSGGAMLLLLFLLPWMFKRSQERNYVREEELPMARSAPPPRERREPPAERDPSSYFRE